MKRVLRRVLQTTVGLMATLVLGGVAAPTAVADTVQGSYLVGGAQANAGVPFFGAGSKAQADGAWDYYQKTIGQPMSEWAKTEVRRAPGGTVFYPFSGPDFVTVSHLFPQADRFVMVAMQAAGEPADVTNMSSGRMQSFQAKFMREWMKFSRLAFFRTDDLNEDLRDKHAQIGVTTILIAFALYSGYDVKAVYPIVFDEASGDYIKGNGPWKSVRLELSKGGKPVVLDYVSLDLSDDVLSQNASTRAWLARESRHPVLLKAASHLLQETYFAVLRDILVENATMVIQDETGLNYTNLAQIGPVDLYGGFLYPHELFNRKKQESLAQAYRESKDVKPLPFAFSYNKTTERRSVQIVRR
jgi:hypothetical protein